MPTLAELLQRYQPPAPKPAGLLGLLAQSVPQYAQGVAQRGQSLASLLSPQAWSDSMQQLPALAQQAINQPPMDDAQRKAATMAFMDKAMQFAPLGMTAQVFKKTPKGLPDYVNNLSSEWRKSDMIKWANPQAVSAIVKDNMDMSVKELADGKLLLTHNPMWGSNSKQFSVVGDSIDEVITAAKSRLESSNKAVAISAKRKLDNSLIGQLQKEYGDNFTVKKSERSKSIYITHKPSGTKIRISDHDLPLGYVQADIDLRSGQSLEDQLAEIKKYLSE